MPQRKIGKTWWVDITHNKKRYRKKSPLNSKAGAQAFEATLRKKLAEGAVLEDVERRAEHSQLFETFAWFWFRTHVKVHSKPSTIAKARSVLTHKLIPFFGATQLNKISTLQVEKYKAKIASTGMSNKTINNELSVLNKCLQDAKLWLGLDSVPNVVRLKTRPSSYDFLNEGESSLLLEQLSGVWFEIVYVALKTGLRRGELQGLRWQDVNLEAKTLTVQHSWCSVKYALLSPKGNTTRTIPLADDVVAILRAREQREGIVFSVNGFVFQPVTLGQQLAQACERAGIRKITCHVLRHSYASQLALNGAPIAMIQILLGHTDIKITMRYAHLSQESVNDAVQYMQRPLMVANRVEEAA